MESTLQVAVAGRRHHWKIYSRHSAPKRKVWVFLILFENQHVVDDGMIGSQLRFHILWYEASDDTGLLGRRFNRSLYFTLKEGPQ